MFLFIDTETTGKFDFKSPVDHPGQPRICQLAAILADRDRAVLGKVSLLIKPDGWIVPPDAAAVHGFGTEQCTAFGVPIALALDLLGALSQCCRTIVAHNSDFDSSMISSEASRLGRIYPFLGMHHICTMRSSTEVLKLSGRYGFKWPSLAEAHRYFFDCEPEYAHDALGDVVSCMKCFFALMDRGVVRAHPSEVAQDGQLTTAINA